MVINIPTTKDQIFKQYLVIINTLLSKNKKLTDFEIEILDKLVYIDNLYSKYPKEQRDKILFSRVTKDKIRQSVYNISEHSYNNAISKLRKKGFITGNVLNVKVPIIDDSINIEFKLKINNG